MLVEVPSALQYLGSSACSCPRWSSCGSSGLHFPGYSSSGYGPLLHMSMLTRLVLEFGMLTVPSCLAQLMQLRDLRICSYEAGMPVAAALADHLPSLQQLTRLDVHINHEVQAAALTAPTNLRSLWWEPNTISAGAALPPGVWLRDLRTLLLHSKLLTNSFTGLANAGQLERLGVSHCAPNHTLLPAILGWAAEQPPPEPARHLR